MKKKSRGEKAWKSLMLEALRRYGYGRNSLSSVQRKHARRILDA